LQPPLFVLVRGGPESPSAWRCVVHNEQIAVGLSSDERGRGARRGDAVLDASAGWRTLEIFAALLPVGWG
jgi:hypothetical protein